MNFSTKSFLQKFKQAVISHLELHFGCGRGGQVLVAVAAFSLLSHFSWVVGAIHESVGTQAVVGAIDNDAGIAIQTAKRTHLYNNNDFTAYGPTYYRAVRILHSFAPLGVFSSEAPSDESTEKSHHFYLMLVSALSLYGLAFLIATVLFDKWFLKLFATAAIAGTLMYDLIWAEMILRAHPDHILAFGCGLAALLTYFSYVDSKSDSKLKIAASAWGLVASIKATVVMFAPMFLALLAGLDFKNLSGQLRSQIVRRLTLILSSAALTYFLIGFPQSLDIGRTISFLLEQSRNVTRADLESLRSWIQLFSEQMQYPVMMVCLLALLLPVRRDLVTSWSRTFLFFGICLLPTALLLNKKVLSGYSWYPFPFIAVILIALGILLTRWKVWVSDLRFFKFQQSKVYAVAIFVALPMLISPFPSSIKAATLRQKDCRAEASIVEEKLNKLAEGGKSILADPYIPYARRFHDKQVWMAWEMRPSLIDEKNISVIAIKSGYYRLYLPADEGGAPAAIFHIEDWDSTRNFYRMFYKKNETLDHKGRRWIKFYEDVCTFELWNLKE